MFEPIAYCACGNTKTYGNWEINPLPVKTAIKELFKTESLTAKEKCPICLCIDAMDKAKMALMSV